MMGILARSLPKVLFLAAMTDFCLRKLDNKYFKLHQDLLEEFIS